MSLRPRQEMSMKPRLILASASPRRRELLGSIGPAFEVVPSNVDEEPFFAEEGQWHPSEIVTQLAGEKAREVASRAAGDALVLGADTIVVLDGHILNKPVDVEDAVRMLMLLQGRTHTVYTGIALMRVQDGAVHGEPATDFAATGVTFTVFDERVARAYVATGEPMDKAGAYGIQQKGAVLIERIDGDYFNVVGLPLNKLAGLLARFGVSVW